MERLACFLDAGRSLDQAVERARLVESLGYESAWVTHIAAREPLQVLGHYARHTERIGLGTGVVPIFLRHPALMAMEAATLDEISGGRLSLGIGVSHRLTIESWYGLTLDDPVGRMRDYATIVRGVLDRDGIDHTGAHYSAHFGFLGYGARRGIRLLFGALGPRMLRLAAELADGVVLWMCSPAYIREVVRPTLDEALAEHGRSPEEFDVVAAVSLSLTEDPAEGRDAFRTVALPYAQLPFYRKAIAAGGHAEDLAAFDQGVAAGDLSAGLKGLSDAFVDDMAGIGDRDVLRAKVGEYRAAGVTLPAVGPLARHEGGLGVEATLEAVAPG